MKRLMATLLALMLCLAACWSSAMAEGASFRMTVEEGIENNLKFSTTDYVDEAGNFYSTSLQPAAMMQKKLQTDGGMPVYVHGSTAVSSNGSSYIYSKAGARYFASTPIVYADYSSSVLLGVAADGRVYYAKDTKPEQSTEITGLSGVKYVNLHEDGTCFVAVCQDGTAVLSETYEGETHLQRIGLTAEGWTDIAWATMDEYQGKPCLIGLKKDGTVVAEGHYPQAVLSWTDMVFVDFTDRLVYGLKADGSVVAAGRDNEQQYIDETLAKITVPVKAFCMERVNSAAAVAADGTLLVEMQKMPHQLTAQGELIIP